MKLGTVLAIVVLLAGILVQVFGVSLIAEGRPNFMMMLSWVVPIAMSINHLLTVRRRAG